MTELLKEVMKWALTAYISTRNSYLEQKRLQKLFKRAEKPKQSDFIGKIWKLPGKPSNNRFPPPRHTPSQTIWPMPKPGTVIVNERCNYATLHSIKEREISLDIARYAHTKNSAFILFMAEFKNLVNEHIEKESYKHGGYALGSTISFATATTTR